MAIPKKIHWCWLSGDPLPPRIQRCVNSWHKVMPDYEVVLWDMNRFDIHSVPFVEQACAAKKWAFAADYIRWYALYTEGGIYLDSDVKVYRRLDKFLQHRAFIGTTISNQPEPVPACPPTTANHVFLEAEVVGAVKGHLAMKKCMDVYQDQKFKLINGVVTVGVAPVVLSNIAVSFGWNRNRVSKPIILQEDIAVYPEKYFTYLWGEFSLCKTHTLHLSNGSWCDEPVNKQDFLLPLRKFHAFFLRNYWICGRLHYKRKNFFRRLKGFKTFS